MQVKLNRLEQCCTTISVQVEAFHKKIWLAGCPCAVRTEVVDPCSLWKMLINLYLTNGFSHHYHLEESTFSFRGVRSDFEILFNFSMKIL